jgi:hypothetical protein
MLKKRLMVNQQQRQDLQLSSSINADSADMLDIGANRNGRELLRDRLHG